MKKFNSIKEFIDYAPRCLFCNALTTLVISSNVKLAKNNFGVILQRVMGQPLYRESIKGVPFGTPMVSYQYGSRVEGYKLIINCTERSFGKSHPNQSYDAMTIDIVNSDIELKPEISVGILNSFVRINFVLLNRCNKCSGHAYSSTAIIGGAKRKKIMPFFLRSEAMLKGIQNAGDTTTYSLKSDYYSFTSQLEKNEMTSEWSNLVVGTMSGNVTDLPLVDLSSIKDVKAFENKVESYIIFS